VITFLRRTSLSTSHHARKSHLRQRGSRSQKTKKDRKFGRWEFSTSGLFLSSPGQATAGISSPAPREMHHRSSEEGGKADRGDTKKRLSVGRKAHRFFRRVRIRGSGNEEEGTEMRLLQKTFPSHSSCMKRSQVASSNSVKDNPKKVGQVGERLGNAGPRLE